MQLRRNVIAPLAIALAMSGAGLGVPAIASATTPDASYSAPPLAAASDPAEAAAVSWAEDQLSSTQWDGLCLEFVQDAYSQGAGFDIGTADSAVDYWNGYTGTQNPPSDNPPVGALVFWGATSSNPYGHVALSVGNGLAISSEERSNTGVHTFSIADRNADGYQELGWVMPD